MNNEELNQILARLKIRHADLAVLGAVTPRCVHNWSSGHRPVPRPMAILLRAIDQNIIPDEWLFEQVATT